MLAACVLILYLSIFNKHFVSTSFLGVMFHYIMISDLWLWTLTTFMHLAVMMWDSEFCVKFWCAYLRISLIREFAAINLCRLSSAWFLRNQCLIWVFLTLDYLLTFLFAIDWRRIWVFFNRLVNHFCILVKTQLVFKF